MVDRWNLNGVTFLLVLRGFELMFSFKRQCVFPN